MRLEVLDSEIVLTWNPRTLGSLAELVVARKLIYEEDEEIAVYLTPDEIIEMANAIEQWREDV